MISLYNIIYIHIPKHQSPTNIIYLCVVYTLLHHYHPLPIHSLLPAHATYICFIACVYTTY